MIELHCKNGHVVLCQSKDIEDIVIGTNNEFAYVFLADERIPLHVVYGRGMNDDGEEVMLDLQHGEFVKYDQKPIIYGGT